MGELPPPQAHVTLRGLSLSRLARLMWWQRVAREARTIVRTRKAPPGGMRVTLRNLRSGFLPLEHVLYDLERPGEYVSGRQQQQCWSLNWPAGGLLDHKLAFFYMLRRLGVPTPEVSGVIVRGRGHALGPGGAEPSLDWLRRRLEDHGRVVIRPTRGSGGLGLRMLERSGSAYRLNGRELGWPEVERELLRLDDHLVTDFVEQAAFLREVFPRATSTLRALTMVDPEGRPFIASALQRFGTSESEPTDNWRQGGLSFAVDPEDGTFGLGMSRPHEGRFEWQDRHPATGVLVAGRRVPNWDVVRDGILTAAARMAFLPYVGWDVVVTDDGFSVIEGNKNCDLGVQVHAPLLTDPRARAFYASHGIV